MPLLPRRFIPSRPGPILVAVLVLSASSSFAHDDVAERIAAVTAQLAGSPASADLLIRRAELYRQAGRLKDALADLDRAGQLGPAPAAVDLVRAHVHHDERNWEGAVTAASAVLARGPRNADALIVRARSRLPLGQTSAAAADFTRALQIQPLPDIYIERARALAALDSSALDEALRGLDEGIARLGPLVTLELEAIDLELRLKRYDAALARLDRVSAQAARKDTWLARRAAILEQAGRLDEARAAYAAALASAARQPDRIRNSRVSIELVERLRAGLARVDTNTSMAPPPGPKRSR